MRYLVFSIVMMNTLASCATVKNILNNQIKISELVPILGGGRRKGQNGRMGVIGGSLEYTGAPYFSSVSQLNGVDFIYGEGADLSYIITNPLAANSIKTYDADLIVYPYLDSKYSFFIQSRRRNVQRSRPSHFLGGWSRDRKREIHIRNLRRIVKLDEKKANCS